MVNLAEGHVDTTHAVNGVNGMNGTNGHHAVNGTNGTISANGINGTPRKRVVVVGLGMVAVSFM